MTPMGALRRAGDEVYRIKIYSLRLDAREREIFLSVIIRKNAFPPPLFRLHEGMSLEEFLLTSDPAVFSKVESLSFSWGTPASHQPEGTKSRFYNGSLSRFYPFLACLSTHTVPLPQSCPPSPGSPDQRQQSNAPRRWLC